MQLSDKVYAIHKSETVSLTMSQGYNMRIISVIFSKIKFNVILSIQEWMKIYLYIYIYIKQKNLTKTRHKFSICQRCFQFFCEKEEFKELLPVERCISLSISPQEEPCKK
jgi:hypothetical protein